MLVVVLSSLLAVYFAYLSQFRSNKRYHLFDIGFVVLTIIACIHYNYGTDYMNYYDLYKTGYNYSSLSSLLANVEKEPGWAILNWFSPQPNGFFIVIALISLVENYAYYKLIKKNVPTSLLWAATAIYVGLTSFYLLNFSMLRQGLAVAMAILSVFYMDRKHFVWAILIVFAASTIHLSALVFLPFLALSFSSLNNGKTIVISILVATVLLFIVKGLAEDFFKMFAESDFSISQYSMYQDRIEAEKSTVGLGFLLNSIKYLVFFYFIMCKLDEFTHQERIILVLSCIPLCLIPFQLEISGIIGRISTYFSAFQIVAIPLTYSKIKQLFLRYIFIIILVFMSLNAYYAFFMNSWATDMYNKPFETIFEVIL